MMETITKELESVKLICPIDFQFIQNKTIDNYPEFCGPANLYLLNKVVKDKLANGKINIAVACHIHDEMFKDKNKSWNNFHNCNYIMFVNCFAIFDKYKERLDEKEKTKFILDISAYLLAIDSIGAVFYWKS